MVDMDESVRVPPSPVVGRYANVFRVGFNAFEMVVEFGEQFSDADQALMHTRVITNPVFARGLVDALNAALEDQAGAIRNSGEPAASVRTNR